MKTIQYSALMILLNTLAACVSSPPQQQSPPLKPSVGVIETTKKSGTVAGKVVAKARSLIGIPYKLGGTSPAKGFDCSGLVVHVYQSVGLHLPRTTGNLMRMRVPKVKFSDLQPGDLLYFATKKHSREVSHVGIYIGDGFFVHAPSSGKTVSKASLSNKYWQTHYLGANRPLN